jgi:Domain of unknown function (DUF6570)
MIDPDGILSSTGDDSCIQLCKDCDRALSKKKLPACALANDLFIGKVPPELSDLTMIEESMISRCCAKCFIIHLKEDKGGADKDHNGIPSGPCLATMQ